jgi:RhtB (resistance to homoserine/threonine) family protein
MLDKLLIVLTVTTLVMLTPGPDMVLVMRNTLVSGRRGGLRTSLGILTGNLVHITYCVLGIGWVIARSIVAYSTLKYLGAAYLIYLGIVSIRTSNTMPQAGRSDRSQCHHGLFVQGLANNLLNPKGTLFYLGVFTTVITPETSAGVMLLLISTMMLVSTSFWLLFVYTLDRAVIRQFMDRSHRIVTAISGGLLVILGIRMAATRE